MPAGALRAPGIPDDEARRTPSSVAIVGEAEELLDATGLPSVTTASADRSGEPPARPTPGGERAAAAGDAGSASVEGVEPRWAQLWFAVQRHSWSTLAIVPADTTASALTAARALARAGFVYRNRAVRMIDATGAEPHQIPVILDTAALAAATGSQIVLALASPLTNPAAIALARGVDAAVLVVPLGVASLATTQRVIESIGRERFIGSVATDDPDSAARAPGRRRGR